MTRLIVVSGPPSAGKSTVAQHLGASTTDSAHVAGDDFFAFLGDSFVPPWLPEAHDQNALVIEAVAAASGRLASRYNVVYEGVISPWFLRQFIAAT